MNLNEAQREAVNYIDELLLVLAGAGSGKTGGITHNIAHLVGNLGIAPNRIAAITFTNKAAKEMQERIAKAIGSRAEGVIISTFHSLGVRILRQECRALKLKPGFSILDATDTTALFQELAGSVDKARLRMMQTRISLWKNSLLDSSVALRVAEGELEHAAAALYVDYERSLNAYQAVDFDDLIRLPVKLFADDDAAAERWRARLWHLLVDEYQDTNRCQYRLVQLLTQGRDSFTAVGDDDQSIYAWRGADAANLQALKVDYPALKVIKLEQNYRSTTRILRAANALIAHNPKTFEKRLWSEHGLGDPIRVRVCKDGDEEAEAVVTQLAAHKFSSGSRFDDYAILYRGNFQARVFEQQLRAQRVPYVISGGQSFFERTEIKDITSYLRLLANENDDPAFIRAVTTPKRGIGSTTLEALGRAAGRRQQSLLATVFTPGLDADLSLKQHTALRQFGDFIRRMEHRAKAEDAGLVLRDLINAIGYEAALFSNVEPQEARTRMENVRDFVEWIADKGLAENKTLLELAQSIALLAMLDKNAESTDAVQLATLHASKGLEFRHVYLVGIEEGSLPHRDSQTAEKIEEERRLMYVGITRARNTLNVTWCERRKIARDWVPREPSRFITEMGESPKSREGEKVPDAQTARSRAADLLAKFSAK
ncbi:MAG: UvrD-helicase domain-containing protein [Rhodocyclaceae bacterium]|nr:UvrD-helicase domain-containing protein [Rhodocyclaceae bacterium]